MSISAVLNYIESIIAPIDPSPAAQVTASYVSPDDEPIVFRSADLPILIVSRNPFVTHEVRRQSKSTYTRRWGTRADIILAETTLPDRAAEEIYYNWEGKLETAYLTDPTLGGAVEWLGELTQGGFDISLGHVPWFHDDLNKAKAYWSIRVEMLVTTKHSYAEDYD